MKKTYFTIPSSDGRTTLHGIRWEPDRRPIGVLQLVHGKSEYVDRYDATAKAACEEGYAVIGHDHLGHGRSVVHEDDLGFFAEQDGIKCLLKDIHRIRHIAGILYPDVPVFLLGHSMGSFLVRRYITIYPGDHAGCVIMGTGRYAMTELLGGKLMADSYRRMYDSHYRSDLLEGLAINPLRKKFGKGTKRPGAWLSANHDNVQRYKEDPLCGFPLTAGAYSDFMGLLMDVESEKNFDRVPREYPLLLMSGMDDPLGGFTQKVLDLYNRYVELGMKDLDLKLYYGDRHEILNEDDADDVRADLFAWMDARL